MAPCLTDCGLLRLGSGEILATSHASTLALADEEGRIVADGSRANELLDPIRERLVVGGLDVELLEGERGEGGHVDPDAQVLVEDRVNGSGDGLQLRLALGDVLVQIPLELGDGGVGVDRTIRGAEGIGGENDGQHDGTSYRESDTYHSRTGNRQPVDSYRSTNG